MVATSLQAVIAQRLVRLNCVECTQEHQPSRREKSWLSAIEPDSLLKTYRGTGCAACNGTGYAGRQGVYELLEMDAALTQAASQAESAAFLQAARARMQGKTLAHHVFELVRQGRTSIAEALRIGLDAELVAEDDQED
jgi:MSHA biogenesis protein MshE